MREISKFEERVARYTLVKLLDYDETDLINKDRPDIQSLSGQIGIEVMQDVFQNEKQCESKIRGIWGMSIDRVEKKTLDTICWTGGHIQADENGMVNWGHLGATENKMDHLWMSMEKKLKILNESDFKKFVINGLYLFVDTVLLELKEEEIITLLDRIKSYSAQTVFDVVFLDQEYVFYICDIHTRQVKKIKVPKEFREERMLMCR